MGAAAPSARTGGKLSRHCARGTHDRDGQSGRGIDYDSTRGWHTFVCACECHAGLDRSPTPSEPGYYGPGRALIVRRAEEEAA